VTKVKDQRGREFYPLSDEAEPFVTALTTAVQNAPQQAGVFVELPDENDAIAPTDFSGGSLTEGLYNLWMYLRVTDPDGVSSSAQVTITWTNGGVTQTFVGTNVNGDTTTSKQQQVIPLYIDGNTAITYEVAYASNTPNAMHYELYISLQLIKAVG
jgi:hypothetical protein